MYESNTYSEVTELLGYIGLAEWQGNENCLDLRFWLQTSKGLKYIEALIPHGLEEDCSYFEPPSEQCVNSAKRSLADLLETCDKGGFNLNGRGFIRLEHLPSTEEVYTWQDDSEEVLRSAEKGLTFRNVIEMRCNIFPLRWRCLVPDLKAYCTTVLELPENQRYLESKASEMADYWASKLGTLGSSGDFLADCFHASLVEKDSGVSNEDICKFRESLRSDILENFREGKVPFYETDYGIGYSLMKVLEKANLTHLSKNFPWKTWKHFDFSDFDMENVNE